ncbi:MAG: NADH-quinone oxidoreductase subunit NuoE [Fimbriimonadaceae bacterium]
MSQFLQLGSPNQRPQPPKPGELNLQFSQKAIEELDKIIQHYPEQKAAILPALWIAQREYGGMLTGDALAEVAFRLKRSYAEIEGVATFYSMYNTEHNPGKHKIEVCTCLTCYLCGAYKIFEHLKEKLGVGNMETTEDGMFMLEEVECLDACDRAPVLQVGDGYYGPVNEKFVDDLIERLRNSDENTVIRLADEIVKVHLSRKDQEAIGDNP